MNMSYWVDDNTVSAGRSGRISFNFEDSKREEI